MPGLLVSYFRWTQRRGTILEEPLQSTAGRVHSRPVGGGVRGALYTASRRWSRAPLPSSGHTNPPPPPPQNEVEVTACAWGGGAGHRGQCSLGLSCITSLDAQGLSCSKPLG